MLYGLLHRVELLALVAFGILSRFPEAEREDAIRLRVGDDHGLVHESRLPPQNGQDLSSMVLHNSRAFPALLVNSTVLEYIGSLLSVDEKGERNVAQIARRPLAFLDATKLRWHAGSVNRPELVQ